MRSFRDRDHITTPEGFIFTVIGNVHPRDRVIAYLKYVQDESGKWGHGQRRYRRALQHYSVPSVMESMRFLRSEAPHYVFHSEVHGFSLPGVPTDRIAEHLRPEEKLAELKSSSRIDELQRKAVELADLISHNASVPVDSLGVSGSILAGIHNPAFSDIDLVVYGLDSALRVKTCLQSTGEPSSDEIRRLNGASQERWIAERTASTPLKRQDALSLLARKWNLGLFQGTEFSVHAIHTENEVHERYGDERHASLGIVEGTAEISSDHEAMFMPAVYQVQSPTFGVGFHKHEFDQIVSYEGLYADIARPGETVRFRGKLEKVERGSGLRHRIVVGSPEAQGTDYLLPLMHSI